jgi:hypothetical protein
MGEMGHGNVIRSVHHDVSCPRCMTKRSDWLRLDYATSFYDGGDEGITVHAVNVTEIEVLSVAFLDGWSTVGERVPDSEESSGIVARAVAAPTS